MRDDKFSFFPFEEQSEDDKGPALELYGTDITSLAREGVLDECFGRDEELLELMEILVRRQKNNPVLIGDAGVGKTAIIELFANRIVNNLVPFVLEGRTIVSLDLARLVAGSRYRGEFELRFQRVIDEVMEQPDIIIFIDEIHNIAGTGAAEGSLDAANILKPVLSRSGFQCIGATTTKEYEKIEKDPALNRRFQPIKVKEPTIDQTVEIIYGLRPTLEAYHNVEIEPAAIRLAVELSNRFIYDRFLPDKAIDVIDRAAAKEVIRLTNITEGSIAGAIVRGSLTKIGALKIEAFRRGDTATEFLLQEVENAYRNFLLRWIANPLEVPVLGKEPKQLSPISEALFEHMRLSILKRTDDLLFSSCKPRKKVRLIKRRKDLSPQKNEEIHELIMDTMIEETQPEQSIYRASVFILEQWFQIIEFKENAEAYKKSRVLAIGDSAIDLGFVDHFQKIAHTLKNSQFYDIENDFLSQDIEEYQESYDILSELEQTRVEIVNEFLRELKPLLRKGMIQSLSLSSEIELNDDERKLIYTLLGYFSTETGKYFLGDTEDPELIKWSRRLGDFTGLKSRITQGHVRSLLAHMTGIPMQSLSENEKAKLLVLEKSLHERVIGQEQAISAIANAIRRSSLGIQNPNRPIASFLFCGPTGVGKTEVTKALASTLFGSDDEMIRLDMSEYMEKFSLTRLIGSPPGYIGYDDGGQLTNAVRRKPYSVVLFDEIEKAHPDVLNILLQILEDGRLTDSQKRLIPFENTVIIMTSNAAADDIQEILKTYQDQNPPAEEEDLSNKNEDSFSKKAQKYLIYEDSYAGAIRFLDSPIKENFFKDLANELRKEFRASFRNAKNLEFFRKEIEGDEKELEVNSKKEEPSGPKEELKNAVMERLSTMFLPEFLNRLDDIIIFQPLRPEELRKICDIMIEAITKRVKLKNLILSVDNRVRSKLAREGYNPAFGARPLRRLMTKYIEDLISDYLLNTRNIKKNQQIKIYLNEDDKPALKEIKGEEPPLTA
jgi:ATP-dependent Clp protease ATP-binding subunit ClpA